MCHRVLPRHLAVGVFVALSCTSAHRVDPDPLSPMPPSSHSLLSADDVSEYLDMMDAAVCEGLLLCRASPWDSVEECRVGEALRRFRGVLPYDVGLLEGGVLGSRSVLERCLEQLRERCPAEGLGPQLADWPNRAPNDSCWEVFHVPPVASGDPCVSRLQCPRGDYCAGAPTRECGPPVCRPRLSPGQPCTHSTQCEGGGDPNTFAVCIGVPYNPRLGSIGVCHIGSVSTDAPSGTCGWEALGDFRAEFRRCPNGETCGREGCVEVPDGELIRDRELGDPCSYPDLTICDLSLRFDCVDNLCVPWGDGSLGSSCLNECLPGLYCSDRECRPALPLGSACGGGGRYLSPRLSHRQCLSQCCGQDETCIEPPPLIPGQPRAPPPL